MRTFSDRVPTDDTAPSDTDTSTQPFRRALVLVKDVSQVEPMVELAQRTGTSEARVVHLNLRESIGGRRYAVETESAAAGVVEAAVLELRVAGIKASGIVTHALVDQAAEAIVAEATEWAADVIVLGSPRRSKLASRLFGSLTLRVAQDAPCPVLVASPAGKDRLHDTEQSVASVAGPELHAVDISAAPVDISAAPVR
jgi:nucleotide-binding universal stress UspA family protein